MPEKPFRRAVEDAAREGRRLVVPLMGFPGLQLTGGSVKLAQQNFGEHFKVVRALAERFSPDAIFPLMDLSVEANALGRFTHFPKAEPATVVQDAFSMKELERAEAINITFDARLMGYVETVKMMSAALPGGMLKGAYVTGPYSLAALIMGADEAAMATMLRPDALHALCRFCTERIQEYARLLICAGAQIICVLEPSAVMLSPGQFAEFSGAYVRHITESCKYTNVATVYHTCGNTMHLAGKMAAAGVDAISLDSSESGVDLPAVAAGLPPEVVVMGNINPTGALLTGAPAEVEAAVHALLDAMAPYPNFVLSTGCDLPQETPLENIAAFMKAGRR